MGSQAATPKFPSTVFYLWTNIACGCCGNDHVYYPISGGFPNLFLVIRMFDAKKMGFHNSQVWMMCMFLRNGLVQRKQQLESLRWGYTPVNQHSNEKLHLTLMIVMITNAFTTKHGIFNGTMFFYNKGYAPEVQHASPENQLFFRWTSRTNSGVYLDVPEFM